MPWFKVDDKFHDHRKVRKASLEAIGLWTLAGSWSSDNLTDGFIPAGIAKRWTRKSQKLAQELVAAGLWIDAVVDGESGWAFHDWQERNPLKVKVEEERAAAKERMRQVRGSRSENVRPNTTRTTPERSGEVRDVGSEPFGRSSATPSRPVPTVVPNGTTKDPRTARKRHIPDGWQPNTHHAKIAADLELNLTDQVARFRDYDKSKGPVWKDHDAAFNNWLRNNAKWGRSSRNPYGKQQETDQLFDEAMQRAVARDQQELMP